MARRRQREPSILDYARDPVGFIRDLIHRTERGRPYVLPPHHAKVLKVAFVWVTHEDCEACAAIGEIACVGHLQLRLYVHSEVKKSGKTLFVALLVVWWALTRPGTEIIIVSNDLEQAQSRILRALVGVLRHNPHLDPGAKILEKDVRFSNASLVTAMASEYKSIAGSNHSLWVADEHAGYQDERMRRILDELTPPPTEPDAFGIMTGVAGWIGESQVWEETYKKGLTGEVLDAELPVYKAEQLVMFWSHVARMPMQTARYLREQAASLRPNAFLRLWENRWVTNESTLITDTLWDGNVDPSHHPIARNKDLAIDLAMDAAVKKDCAACVAVARAGEDLVLINHRIWTPAPDQPLDLELTMEAWVYEMAHNFTIRSVTCDPMQLQRFIGAGRRAGLPMVEFAQTIPNLTKMGETLLACLRGQTIRLYPDAELRQHALNTIGVESPRGFRISKTTASRKIDGVIALAMACVAALDGIDVRVFTPEEEQEMAYQEARYLRMLGYEVPRVPYGGWSNYVGLDHVAPGATPRDPWPGSLDPDLGYCDEPL